MKKIILPALAAALLSSTAMAADLPGRGPAVAPAPVFSPAPVFTWTGVYIGGQIGYAWGKDSTTEFVTATGLPTGFAQGFKPDGMIGGLHAGFNYQMGSIVLGVETDIEASGYKGGYRLLNGDGTDSETNWQGSLRGRVGVAMDRALIYATGGLAYANFTHTYIDGVAPIAAESFKKTDMGWTAGVGLEYAFTRNLTARAEYRYSDYGNFNHVSLVAFPGNTYRQNPSNHAVRFGVSYLFNMSGSGPVVAKF